MNHLAPTVFQVFALLFSWWRLERRLAVFDVKFLINAYCRLQRLVREGWTGPGEPRVEREEMLANYSPPTLLNI